MNQIALFRRLANEIASLESIVLKSIKGRLLLRVEGGLRSISNLIRNRNTIANEGYSPPPPNNARASGKMATTSVAVVIYIPG